MFGNLLTKLYLMNLERKGFVHGQNFNIEKGANIDAAFCSSISVGDNVTLAKDVYILAHDASTKKFLGKTKYGKVYLGNNVFVGARAVILPGVTVGNDVIIASCSCVTQSIPSGEVWGGSPAKYIMSTEDFLAKHKQSIMTQDCESDAGCETITYID